MNIKEMIAKAQERKQREQREAIERLKASPMYQKMKEIMAEKAKEKAEHN